MHFLKQFLFFVMILATIFLTSCMQEIETSENRIAMHTLISIRAVGIDSKIAVDRSFERIHELETIFKEDLTKIETNSGKFVDVHDETFKLLEISQKISQDTNGAFDITIGAANSIWNFEQKKIPTLKEINSAKNLIGFNKLKLDKKNHRVMIIRDGVKLDLGGIAKGFAADEVRKIFNKYQIHSGLIQMGASTISAVGKKSDGSKWTVGIKNPRDVENILEVIELDNQTISTSGDYEKFFILDGVRYHHILDPKTCMPVQNGISSVSVIVPNSVDNAGSVADAYSTACFITGEKVYQTKIFYGGD